MRNLWTYDDTSNGYNQALDYLINKKKFDLLKKLILLRFDGISHEYTLVHVVNSIIYSEKK